MRLTLERAKELKPSSVIPGVINCIDNVEAEDILRAACCWLTHLELQTNPSLQDLESAYLKAQSRLADRVLGDQSKGVSFPAKE